MSASIETDRGKRFSETVFFRNALPVWLQGSTTVAVNHREYSWGAKVSYESMLLRKSRASVVSNRNFDVRKQYLFVYLKQYILIIPYRKYF